MPNPTEEAILDELKAIHQKLDELFPVVQCLEHCTYTMLLHSVGGDHAELHMPEPTDDA